MLYSDAKKLVRGSGTFEGIDSIEVADALVGALHDHIRSSTRELDEHDVRTAAAAAYELGKRGLERPTFWSLNTFAGGE